MLKSLLFSLTLMLCLTCGSPLTQAAEDVRPEKPAPAESQTSTEDRYKALLRRLDTIESKLETEKQTKQHIDAALKEFDAKTQGQVSMLSTGFTALGAMTGILALAGLVIAVLTSKMYLQSLRGYRKELAQIQQEARKNWQNIQEVQQQVKEIQRDIEKARQEVHQTVTAAHEEYSKFQNMSQEISLPPDLSDTERQEVEKATTQGVGTEVLRGKAILAQQAKRWQEALLYWQSVLETSPHDDTALFGASLAALRLSMKATGEERQRLWQTAEKYFKAFPKEQLTAAVLHNWGLLCQNRGEASTDSNERTRWFTKAEEKYRKATEVDPDSASSWSNWGNLCILRGNATTDNSVRDAWYNKAEDKFRKATKINPNHLRWYNWGTLCVKRGDAATDNRVRDAWYNKAEDKFRKATKINPNHAASWNNWSILCMSQGKATSDADTREHWYAEADKNLTKALDIAPRYASAWFNKACLASLRQDVKTCVDALEQWRTYDSNASTYLLDNDSDFDNVRDTPEFQEFRKKLADNK